jgi:hypothetical protein
VVASASRTTSVSIQIGWMVPTSTPLAATSVRSALGSASTPAFVAAYAPIPGPCEKVAADAVKAT